MPTATPSLTQPVALEQRQEISADAWRVFAVAAAGVFVVFLDATVINIAFPALQAEFSGVTRAGLSWVLNAYAVVFGALLVTAGRLADDRGRKRVFLWGLVLFATASALCGIAPTVPMLVAARAVQAVGAALLVPASLALVLPEFPLAKRATAVGLWGAVGGLAAASGPSIGAVLVDGPGWRWVFLVNVPFCAGAVLFGRHVLRESKGPELRSAPDYVGVLLVTAVMGLLSLGLVQGETWGWTSARVLGAFAAAAIGVPVLIAHALRHPDPVFPVRLFRVRTFSAATAGVLLFAAGFFGMVLCNVLFLTQVWHYSILRTALAILPGPLIAAAFAPQAGRLADRFGHRVVIVPGGLAFAAGTAWFALRVGGDPSYLTHYLPGAVLTGIGVGLAFATFGAAGAHALPPQSYAVGTAVGSASRQLGAVLGVSGLVAALGTPTTPVAALEAFHRGWWLASAAAVAAAITALAMRRD
ncbi:MAG: hypothetical protein QOJ79_3483 [Actinomycetota bacterium]|nr:hypothetical protein [Actinomycetota bacterium]